jgi:Plasmid pRiA4b ORF-3-like protein
LRLRTGSRFLYEYDLNVAWQHEIRIEAYMEPAAGQTFPACVGGSRACPPEDSGGPARFMDRRDDLLSLDHREDLETMVEILNRVFLEDPPQPLTDDMRGELEFALNRARARQQAQGRPFSRRQVNASLHCIVRIATSLPIPTRFAHSRLGKHPAGCTQVFHSGATISLLKELIPDRISPERRYLETRWASRVPYAAAASLLKAWRVMSGFSVVDDMPL